MAKLKTNKGPVTTALALPLNYLLQCSDADLDSYMLRRQEEVANLRSQLIVLLDQLIDEGTKAAIANWFRIADRRTLREWIENEESPLEMARRIVRERGKSQEDLAEELIAVPPMEPRAANRAKTARYRQGNLREEKCEQCPQPQDPRSIRYCTKHLQMRRLRKRPKNAKGEPPGSIGWLYQDEGFESRQGRMPGTLANLALQREKKTRSVLLELGFPPESAAVTLRAVKEAIVRCAPDSPAKAITAVQLFAAALVPCETTGYRAIKQLLAERKIQRKGDGTKGKPYKYFSGVGQ